MKHRNPDTARSAGAGDILARMGARLVAAAIGTVLGFLTYAYVLFPGYY